MKYIISEEQLPIFKEYHQKGIQILMEIYPEKGPIKRYGFWKKRKAKKAIEYFQKCLSIIPNHWQTMMLIADMYKSMGENVKALVFFKQVVEIEKTDSGLLKEASHAARKVGEIELAIKYSSEAIKLKPDDYELLSIHAYNLIIAGNDKDAFEIIKLALSYAPYEPYVKNNYKLIAQVIEGKRKRPEYFEPFSYI